MTSVTGEFLRRGQQLHGALAGHASCVVRVKMLPASTAGQKQAR
jgi:hypothetical protein